MLTDLLLAFAPPAPPQTVFAVRLGARALWDQRTEADASYSLRMFGRAVLVSEVQMPFNHDFTSDDGLFAGDDMVLVFSVFGPDNITPYDVTGLEIAWVLATNDRIPATVITKRTGGTGITLEGVFNVDPLLNTQAVLVSLIDADTDDLPAPMTYRHALKRMTDNAERVLSYGHFPLKRAPTPEE